MAFPINSPVGGLIHGDEDDIVIAVMGSTGTGKSSFIKLLTGIDSIKIGDELESETSDVQTYRFRDASGRIVTIVDTPGFDDSRAGVSDTDILKRITQFLLDEYDENRKLTGLIYLTRISDPRFSGQSSRNLRMFRSLCGTESYKNVVVLTTFWDQVTTKEAGVHREEQLMSNFFKDLVEGGARFMRHDRTIENTRHVIDHIFMLAPVNVQIPREIREEGKVLEETVAGSVHREEVERLIAKHKSEAAELKSEMEAMKESNKAARRELEEERAKLMQQLERWESEKSELKKGLDEERMYRERLIVQAAKEKESHDQWREEQELKFNAQAEAHDKSLQKMKDELENIQTRKYDEAVRAGVQRALTEKRRKPFVQKGLKLGGEIPLVPNFVGKPVLGAAGLALDVSQALFKRRGTD